LIDPSGLPRNSKLRLVRKWVTLDAVQELRILGAGFLLDIDAVNA